MISDKYVPSYKLLEESLLVRDDYNRFVRDIRKIRDKITSRRYKVSQEYLSGRGLEVGAFNSPTPLQESVEADYVDQITIEEIKRRFPKYEDYYCAYPIIIDNGEELSRVADNEYDFLIANHMLEHTQNLFKTIQNHLRVIKKGGVLFYAVPDKRFTFDNNRELTTYKHLKEELLSGPQRNSFEHYLDVAENIENLKGEEAQERARQLNEEGMDTHFHVWTSETFIEHIEMAIKDEILKVEILEHSHEVEIESITILRKL
jgi:predicted SAM-dependent methyltransferase